jgi:hypothetical protein
VKTEGCAQLVDLVATILSGDEIPRTEPEDQDKSLVVPAREDSQGCSMWRIGYANGLQADQVLRGQAIGEMMPPATGKL